MKKTPLKSNSKYWNNIHVKYIWLLHVKQSYGRDTSI